MKYKNLIILLVILITLGALSYPWFFSAGGVGSIQSYEFDVSRSVLSKKFDSLVLNDSKVGIPSKAIYNLDGTGYEYDARYIYLIENNSDTLAYRYKFSQQSSENKTIIALTHCGNHGDYPLKTRSDIFFFQKKFKAKKFEEILKKILIPHKKK